MSYKILNDVEDLDPVIDLTLFDVIAFNTNTFFGKLVKWATKSNLSHVGLFISVMPQNPDYCYIGESWGNGFYIRKRHKNTFEYVLTSKQPLNNNPNQHFQNMYGKRYDWIGILIAAIYILIKKNIFPKWMSGTGYLHCSEGIVRFFKGATGGALDLEKFYNKPPECISPINVYQSGQFDVIYRKPR